MIHLSCMLDNGDAAFLVRAIQTRIGWLSGYIGDMVAWQRQFDDGSPSAIQMESQKQQYQNELVCLSKLKVQIEGSIEVIKD